MNKNLKKDSYYTNPINIQNPFYVDLIKTIIFTEKTERGVANEYTFHVDKRLTKPKIKSLIEELYQVRVLRVNTHCPPRKEKGRIPSNRGSKPNYKKAIITTSNSSKFLRQISNTK
jgi:large subunit ribosomal protein L23